MSSFPFQTLHQRITESKRNERSQRIDQLKAYQESLNEHERYILGISVAQLSALVRKGEIKPRDSLLAYGKRVIEAQHKFNPLTEIMIKDAETWADQCTRTGPLAGVPVSLKDSLSVAGYDCTLGFSKNAFKPRSEDSCFVKLLRDAGAIPYVKTNVPLTMLSFDAYNDMWGTTENPHKPGWCPGGSSSGEAALLAFGASRVGIGSDIAGSVRLPAHFSGIYSLKCSTMRFPVDGSPNPIAGQEGIPGTYAPMARSLEDLKYFTKALVDMKPWTYCYSCIALPWREPGELEKVKFGVMWDDGVIPPSPACKRALQQTVDALRAKGYEIVNFTPPRPFDALRIASQLLMSDGGKISTQGLYYGENNDFGMQRAKSFGLLPRFLRTIYAWLVANVWGDPLWAELIRDFGEKTMEENWALAFEREVYKSKFFKAWNDSGIDFLLTVPNATPAFRHKGLVNSFSSCGYTFLFNLLDYTAGVLPVTKVDPNLDQMPSNFNLKKLNGIARGAYMNYKPNEMRGLPVGVQIVGRRFEEEKVLAGMEIVDQALRDDGVEYQHIPF